MPEETPVEFDPVTMSRPEDGEGGLTRHRAEDGPLEAEDAVVLVAPERGPAE